MNVRRKKPTIEQIVITEEKLGELNKGLHSNNMTRKRNLIKKVFGGRCRCDSIPTKKVSYDQKGARLVDYYCDSCFPTDTKNLK